jgi:hypothetical protein
MGTRSWSRLAEVGHARSLEIDDQMITSLAELALALPSKMANAVRAILQLGATRPGGDGIDVSAVSGEWLGQYRADSGKRGDAL